MADHRSASKSSNRLTKPIRPRVTSASSYVAFKFRASSMVGAGPIYSQELPMTADGHFKVPTPVNEPVRAYAPGDTHRKSLKARLAELTDARTEVPMQIGGERRWGSSRGDLRSPHRHELAIAEYAVGSNQDFDDAVAAALKCNTVVFKPATQTLLVTHFLMEILNEAGLPPGVINMVSGSAAQLSERVLGHKELAGIHFTGSTEVFQGMWRTVGEKVGHYRTYPRLVGETGGKDFVVAPVSAVSDALRTALIRGAFE